MKTTRILPLLLSLLTIIPLTASAQAPYSLAGKVVNITLTDGANNFNPGTICFSFVDSYNFAAVQYEGSTEAMPGTYTYSRDGSYQGFLSVDILNLSDQTITFDLSFNTSSSGTVYATQEGSPDSYGTGTFYTHAPAATPGVPALITPSDYMHDTELTDPRPTFSWSQTLSASTWFCLYVQRNGAKCVEQWVQGCSWTPSTNLPAGDYTWWVRGWNAAGLGTWSRDGQFSILASTPILTESFEGSFPGGWSVGDANWDGTDSYWGKVDSGFGGQGTHGGSYKGFCSGSAYDGTYANPYYYNAMNANMSKTIDLTYYTGAILTFWYKLGIQEGSDWANIYVDDSPVWSSSSSVSAWTKATVDLSYFTGSSHTLRFEFYSDYAYAGGQGWYLDDISLVGLGGPSGPPGAVSLQSPEQGSSAGKRPEFTWAQTVPASTWFHLTALRNGAKCLDLWTQDTGYSCTNDMAGGYYSWCVQGWNSEGLGTLSSYWTFLVPFGVPTQPSIVSPNATQLMTPTATYTWTADENASWYEVCITKNGASYLDKWYSAAELAMVYEDIYCGMQLGNHGQGTYTWKVRAWGVDGMSPWSTTAMFTVPNMCPGYISPMGPSGTQQNYGGYVSFGWTHQLSAAWYELCVTKNGQAYCDQWFAASPYWYSSASILQSNYSAGTYTWKVRAWGPDGMGPWSTTSTFTLLPQPPEATTLITPSGTSYAPRPTFQWNTASGATWYYLYVAKDGSKYCDVWTQSTSWTPTTNLPMGSYSWYVRTWNADGYGNWSTPAYFYQMISPQ